MWYILNCIALSWRVLSNRNAFFGGWKVTWWLFELWTEMYIFMLDQPCSLTFCCLYSSSVFTQILWSCKQNKLSGVEYAVDEQQNCSSHQTTWKLGFLRARKLWVFLSSNYSEGTEELTGKHHELLIIIWGNFRGICGSVLAIDPHSGKRWFANPFIPGCCGQCSTGWATATIADKLDLW